MDHITGIIFRISNIFPSHRVLSEQFYSFYKILRSKSGWRLLIKNGSILFFIGALITFLLILNPINPLDTLETDSLYFFSQVIILLLHTCSACLVIRPGSSPRLISNLPVLQYTLAWRWVVILDFDIPPPSVLTY